MTKLRVHELAKELGMDNKELLDILAKKKVEVKSHMSSLEEQCGCGSEERVRTIRRRRECGREERGSTEEYRRSCRCFVRRMQKIPDEDLPIVRREHVRVQDEAEYVRPVQPEIGARPEQRPQERRPSGWCVRREYSPPGRHSGQTARAARPQEKAEQTNSSQAAGSRGQHAAITVKRRKRITVHRIAEISAVRVTWKRPRRRPLQRPERFSVTMTETIEMIVADGFR